MGRRSEDALSSAPWRLSLVLLLAALAVAAFLRFDRLGQPSFWLDEILGDQLTTKALSEPLWRWVTGLEHEHGPLYYLTQLAARGVGHDEGTGRLPAALFGVATVPLVWLAARRLGAGGAVSAAACAILLATSPLHVYYSREARPYALLMMLTAGLLVVIEQGGVESASRTSPPAVRLFVLAFIVAAMAYTTAVAAPVIAAATVTLLLDAALTRDGTLRRGRWQAAVVAGASLALFPLLYGTGGPSTRGDGFPHVSTSFVASIAQEFTVSALGVEGHGHTVAALFVLAVIGVVALVLRNRRMALVVGGMTLLPFAFGLALLYATNHWFAVRYVSAALIGFIVLAGVGAEALTSLVVAPLRRWKPAVAEVATLVLVTILVSAVARETWPAARSEAFQKLDWRTISRTIARHLRPGDRVLTAEPWSDVAVRYYLDRVPPDVRVDSIVSVPMADILTRSSKAAWLVSAGYTDAAGVRSWTCRYPLVLAGPLESFRLHYAPSAFDFLVRHGDPATRRAFAAAGAATLTVTFGSGDDPWLGEGWASAEGPPSQTFRWVVGREASLLVPARGVRDRVIAVHAMPLAPAGMPRQRMNVVLNGRSIGEAVMYDGWGDYAFTAPAESWIDGPNRLAFLFDHAIAPAAVAASSDRRQLAACFVTLTVSEVGAPVPATYVRSPIVRLAADELLAVKGVVRGTRTLFPSEHLDRAAVESLLGRVGFDPETAWPRLASREYYLEDFVTTFAIGSECVGDEEFLAQAFAAIVQRAPNSVEHDDLLRRLRSGDARSRIVNRILNAADLRARLLR